MEASAKADHFFEPALNLPGAVNGATGVSDMSGKALRVEVEHCGRQLRYN